MSFSLDVVVVGGCGHVGLPLGIGFADRGRKTVVYDINAESVAKVNRAELPFDEPGAQPVIERVVGSLSRTAFRRTAAARRNWSRAGDQAAGSVGR